MRLPKISIITPSYNQAQYLEETIKSVLSQGYPNLEYIIIDGGSTDNSVEIIKKYEKYLAYWVSEKDNGQSDAINKGFARATGDIFAWLNSDDMYYAGTLQKIAKYWVEHPDCRILTGDGEFVDASGNKREYYVKASGYSFNDLLKFYDNKYLPQPSVFFTKDAFFEAGGLDNSLYIALDLDLWLRITMKHKLHYEGSCLSKLRAHKDAKTQQRGDLVIKEVAAVTAKYLAPDGFFHGVHVRIGLKRFEMRTAWKRLLKKAAAR